MVRASPVVLAIRSPKCDVPTIEISLCGEQPAAADRSLDPWRTFSREGRTVRSGSRRRASAVRRQSGPEAAIATSGGDTHFHKVVGAAAPPFGWALACCLEAASPLLAYPVVGRRGGAYGAPAGGQGAEPHWPWLLARGGGWAPSRGPLPAPGAGTLLGSRSTRPRALCGHILGHRAREACLRRCRDIRRSASFRPPGSASPTERR